jgi:4'-phosphopantetheinyl transferase
MLSADELRRADRFRGEELRRRFVAGRGSLRAVLGLYLDRPPDSLSFAYGVHGKPRLADDPGVEFNLAHTQDVALCALADRRIVGVDVEAIKPVREFEKIIDRFFSAAEQEDFLGHQVPERVGAFFRGWSRKEAYLKARGTGLATRLDSFDVSLVHQPPSLLLRVDGSEEEAQRWTLVDLDVGPGYAAAVAVESGGMDLRLFDAGDSSVLKPG